MEGKSAVKKSCKLMGNHFELTVVADDEKWAHERIGAGVSEIQRIERLLTTFSDDSETNLINQMAGIGPAVVSAETFNLIERSLRISQASRRARICCMQPALHWPCMAWWPASGAAKSKPLPAG